MDLYNFNGLENIVPVVISRNKAFIYLLLDYIMGFTVGLYYGIYSWIIFVSIQ